MSAPYRALTLAIHPSTRGFGWVAFEGPFSPYDWGTVSIRGADKNERCLRKVERLLQRLTPETLVLEAFEKQNSLRRSRVTKLGFAIVALAAAQGTDVTIYSFSEVRACFAHMGARTRWDIAAILARQFGAFNRMLPRKRKAWEQEQRRMPLFNAAALAVASYQFGAVKLLETLRRLE